MGNLDINAIERTILDQIFDPDGPALPRKVAEELLEFDLTDGEKQRMSELAAKARDGSLTDNEQAEVKGYEHISSLLGLLKSKVRRSLQGQGDIG